MLVVMQSNATEEQVRAVCERIESLGYRAHPMPGAGRTAIGITGNSGAIETGSLDSMPGVVECIAVSKPYKLVGRELKPENTVVRIPTPSGEVSFGGKAIGMVAGPCAIESREQAFTIAERIRASGARLFRGGAYKPRTSPYSFQGMGEEGLKILAEVRDKFGLGVITEAIDNESLDLVEKYADVIQIGARNMQNFSLLKRAGRAAQARLAEARDVRDARRISDGCRIHHVRGELQRDPVRARRAHLHGPHPQHARPERGSGGSAAEPFAHRCGPSRTERADATKCCRFRAPPWRSARMESWSKCIIDPARALSDGPQSILPEEFTQLMRESRDIAAVLGRTLN